MNPHLAQTRRALGAFGLLDPPEALALAEEEGLPEPAPPTPAHTTSGWRIPPPGFGLPTRTQRPATLRGGPGTDDTVEVIVSDLADASDRYVVVLSRERGQWRVLSPRGPSELRTLAEAARPVEGGLMLELHTGARGHRLALAFPTRDLPPDWERAPARRWAPLREAIASGKVPLSSVQVDEPR